MRLRGRKFVAQKIVDALGKVRHLRHVMEFTLRFPF